MTPRPPLDELLALFQATVAAEGVTTGPGAGTGTSIVDAGLAGAGANSFFSMLIVVYPGQPRLVDSMDITAFNNGTGEVTFSSAYKGVAAAIPAGVPYKIVTLRLVPAEVAAIEAKLDLPAPDSGLNTRIAEVVGNEADTIPAMNLAPGVTDSIIRHIKAILERVGATPADPDDSLLTNVGQRDNAATADDLSDVATTSIQAKLRRILLRMSGAGIFSADIQGAARTELDTMLAQLATYFVVAGVAWSVTVNPGGGAKTDLVSTLSSIADMLAGATGIATYPGAANIGDGVSMAEALRAILTSLVAGDDYDAYTAINNVARASVNAAFQGIASVLGADGANVFNPTIQGVARTDLDTALYQFALYFNALGATLAVVSQPGVAARTNLNDILTDLADILAGATGITHFPAASAAADSVSLAEVIRYIQETCLSYEGATALANKLTAARAGYLDNINNADLANVIRDIAQATGTFAFDESAAGEQTIFSVVVAARAKVGAIWLDLNTLTLNNTIRIKHKIDGATYRTFSTHSWVFATDDKGVLLEGFTAYRDFQVTMQCAGGGAAGKNVPYAVV